VYKYFVDHSLEHVHVFDASCALFAMSPNPRTLKVYLCVRHRLPNEGPFMTCSIAFESSTIHLSRYLLETFAFLRPDVAAPKERIDANQFSSCLLFESSFHFVSI
jgi:hypothetical protein